MKMITHILISTDGSETAEKAVDHGLELARQLAAKVTILTVTERWSALEMARKAREGAHNPLQDYNELAERHATIVLERAKEKAKQAKIDCETVYKADSGPAEAIVAEADRSKADLIVMASHGRRGLDRVMLGSVTQRVLALTARPVLVYR
jgi:nucleotide-binding universal stress UspA family protein